MIDPDKEKQGILKAYAFNNGNIITKKKANDLLRGYYYTNHDHYVTMMLTRMVRAGTFKRVKRGEYELIAMTPKRQPKAYKENELQMKLI